MNKPGAKQFSFNSFWLDVEKRQLLHRNQRVVLTRKALDTLGLLVLNAGRVVSREELKRLVWGDAFVEEATIAQNIFTLRKNLSEHEPGQSFIETIAGVGYRFTGQVQTYSPEAPAEKIASSESQRSSPAFKVGGRMRWVAAARLSISAIDLSVRRPACSTTPADWRTCRPISSTEVDSSSAALATA